MRATQSAKTKARKDAGSTSRIGMTMNESLKGSEAAVYVAPTMSPDSETRGRSSSHSIEANLVFTFGVAVAQSLVGEIPGGFRIDLRYSSKDQGSTLTLPLPDGSCATASILSGNDWISVTNEGVIDFDSRITVEFVEPNPNPKADDPTAQPRVPVSGRFRSRASIRDAKRTNDGQPFFEPAISSTALINSWKKGLPEGCHLPLVFTVGFDIPSEGFSKGETELYEKLRGAALGRSLFIGDGRAQFDGKPFGNVSSIDLRLFLLSRFPEVQAQS